MNKIELDKENHTDNYSDPNTDIKDGDNSKFPSITDFDFIKPISKGGFAKVFLGQKKSAPDTVYAIKVMKKADMVKKNLIKQVITERDALVVATSPFVVKLYYSLQSQQNIFLIMEYLIGGDVKSLLTIYGYFDEDMAVMYAAEVALALEYLHKHGIIHRDLKPDNMLITDQGHIKLTDFGLSEISLDSVEELLKPSLDPKSNNKFYRTPGQILSLKSSLAFNLPSVKKARKPSLFQSPQASGQRSHYCSPKPLVERSPFCSPLRRFSTTSPLLRFSLSPSRRGIAPRCGSTTDTIKPPAPIQSLTPTLQDSLNWTTSDADSDISRRRHSTRNSDKSSSLSEIASELKVSLFSDSSDSAFGPTEHRNSSDLPGSGRSSERCHSHLKSSSRQEDTADDTPQLHRSDEAVWNSYAARNLRSIREGSYSEDSEVDSDIHRECSASDADLSISYLDTSVESGRFTSVSNRGSSGYSYPSDDDEPDHSQRQRLRNRRSFELSDDSGALSRRSSLGVHTLGVIAEEKPSSRRPGDDRATGVDGSQGGWRGDGDECDVSIGRKDERCRLTFRSTSSEETAPSKLSYTGLTQEIRTLSVRQKDTQTTKSPKQEHNTSTDRRLSENMNGRRDVRSTSCDSFLSESSECIDQPSPTSPLGVVVNSGLTREIKALVLQTTQNQKHGARSRLKDEHDTSDSSGKQTGLHSKSSGLTQEFKGLDLANICQSKNQDLDITRRRNSLPSLGKSGKLVRETSKSRKRAYNEVDSMDDIDTDDYPEKIYGDEHLRKRSNIDSPTAEDMRCLDDCDIASSTESSPLVFTTATSPQSADMKSPPFSVVVMHNSPDMCLPQLPPSPQAPRPCVHKKKELSLSPVPGQQRKDYFSDDMVFKSPISQRAGPENACVCNSRFHLNSKSSLKDSPALTFEKAARRKVSLIPAPFTPANTRIRTPCMTPFRAVLHTPFRTPKSVRRNTPQPAEEHRILGTPDYLSPEILLQKPHGMEVDWWALGVCLFEFLTGIPPFNDQTPDSVFENILNRDIPWPEGEEALSHRATEAIDRLLTMDPDARPGAAEVRQMAFFSDTDWDNILDKQPAFVPEPDNDTDTVYFEARNTMQNLVVSAVDL